MGLLSFDPHYRRMWMFPRNIRNIAPWKIYQILTVLMKCSDLDLKSGQDQKYVYKMLEDAGVKGKGKTRDKNPGGMRTYYSQLEMLGLIYENSDRQFRYTIAGQAVANAENPLRVLQYQILRHQYPSAYGRGRNVQIDPRIKVKPFMFILKMIQDERIDSYMTSQEMLIPVVYGHNESCYDFCISKVIEMRRHGDDAMKVLDDYELDLFTPRSGMGTTINNANDIANTAKNYLQAVALIVERKDVHGKRAYSFNDEYADLYQEMLSEVDDYVPFDGVDDEESFQRAYGRYNKAKDTRSDAEGAAEKEAPEQTFIQFQYILYSNDNLFVADEKAFYASMKQMGISESAVSAALVPYHAKRRSIDENNFLEFANSGGAQSEEFEKALANLLRSIGFDDSQWVGRKKSKSNWRGDFPDVLIKCTGSNDVGFADAKASSKYSLGHDDMLKMKDTYIHSNKELVPDSELKYFIYVAGGYRGDIASSVMQLSATTGLPVTAFDARTALRLRDLKDKGWSPKKFEEEIFCRGGLVTESDLAFMG